MTGSYSIHPSVIHTEIDDSMVLLHLTTKRYYTINSTGVVIWKSLLKQKSIPEIVAVLLAEYDASEERLQGAVVSFLEKLERAELVQRQ